MLLRYSSFLLFTSSHLFKYFFLTDFGPHLTKIAGEFNCEVEDDGTVIITGVTTHGEKIVRKYSQVFEMQSQNLCPSGHFSMSFKLPGPVNPQQFTGNFGTDAILEGIVMKAKQNGK